MNWLTGETVVLLVQGVLFTVVLTAVTSMSSFVIGIGVGRMRLSQPPIVRTAASVFVDTFRNIPALVLIIFFAFAVPNLFPPALRQRFFFNNMLAEWGQGITGLSLPYYALAAAAALTLNTSAYLAELFRAGVGTIPQEMVDAARSMGGTKTAVFYQILLPEGVRAAFPAITSRLIHNLKNTALASFVAVPELFHATQSSITYSFRATEFLLLAAVLYLLLSFLLSVFLRRIEHTFRSASHLP
ncbi:MAG: ABC transporter permease subunit [Chloroflexi bacterium]|nr:MAG: ABC transporter permease subunit [Chloroflexota bacterium]